MNHILIIAGEASGDMHGAGFVREFLQIRPDCRFFGLGGDMMAKAGVNLTYHIKSLAFFGFWEVLRNLWFLRHVKKELLSLADELQPKMAVLIDYPGFNLRLAPKLKKRGVKIFYYISPQIWAWGEKRVNKIRNSVDMMATIFEFEKDIYEKAAIPVKWVGHPLIDTVKISLTEEEFRHKADLEDNDILIGLFPGSREQEVKKILPEMLSALKVIKDKNIKGVISRSPALDESVYREIIDRYGINVTVLEGINYELMAYAKMNIVCSGTATLECAIIGTPMVVVYKTSFVTYCIARNLVKIPDIGLVNVVAGKRIVPELIQNDCTAENIADITMKYLEDDKYYRLVKEQLSHIKSKLGDSGAAKKAAVAAVELMQSDITKT